MQLVFFGIARSSHVDFVKKSDVTFKHLYRQRSSHVDFVEKSDVAFKHLYLQRSSHVDFVEKSDVTFKHLYLQNWTGTYETMPYPLMRPISAADS